MKKKIYWKSGKRFKFVYVTNSIYLFEGSLGKIFLDLSQFGLFFINVNQFFIANKSLQNVLIAKVKEAILAVTKGFVLEFYLQGTGYRCWLAASRLFLNLGFSHWIGIKIPKGIKVFAKRNKFVLFSINRNLLGNFQHELLRLKKPDVYKGKGIRLKDDVIKLRVGKQRQR